MVALDTNILVYAHRRDSAWHEPALRAVTQLAQGHSAWAIPWPCIWEFLAIVTHPRIYNPPSPIDDALIQERMPGAQECFAVGFDGFQCLPMDGPAD